MHFKHVQPFSLINVFFSFSSICLSGPAYSAGLIGKDVIPLQWSSVIHTTVREVRERARRGGGEEVGRSNSLGPLHQSQVGQEGVFVGGG